MSLLQDACQQANNPRAPRAKLPKLAQRLRELVDKFWSLEFPAPDKDSHFS